MPDAEIVIWGPPDAETLPERLARYLSPPLTPLHLHELPARVSFRACPKGEWEIGPARIQAAPVNHPGPTLGYRISEGDTLLCYIPDQELALDPPLSVRERQSLPGFDLAHGASLLVHDCQYTDDEYPNHIGWGHSRLGERARLRSAHRGTAPPPLPPRPAPRRRAARSAPRRGPCAVACRRAQPSRGPHGRRAARARTRPDRWGSRRHGSRTGLPPDTVIQLPVSASQTRNAPTRRRSARQRRRRPRERAPRRALAGQTGSGPR